MSRLAKIAEIPAGSWTKWLVVGFWVVVFVIALPLSSKLTGAEKNDAKAWLPADAQSTKVLDLQARFQSPNIYPGVVVYERASGLTAADRAKAAVDARRFAGVHGVVPGQVVGPIPSADGKAIETVVSVNLGKQGWNGAATAADSIGAIAASNTNGLAVHITGPLGNAADSGKVFKGIDSTLLYSALAVVIVILLITYRSPVLWLLPVISSGVALITAQAVIYLLAAHAGLTVNAQSAGILDVLVFGVSTDYALLIVARYREELRRHDRRHAAMAEALRRAGPAIIASGSTVIVALLTLPGRGPAVDEGPGAGARDRRCGRHALHDHPSPRPAGDLPPGSLLAVPARLRHGRADDPGTVGAGGLEHRTPAAADLDHHRRGSWHPGSRADRPEGPWPDHRARLPRASRFRDRRDRARPAFPRGRGRARHRHRQPERGGPAAVRPRRYPGHRRRDAADGPGGPRLPRGDIDRTARQPGRLHHDRPGAGRRARHSRRQRRGRRRTAAINLDVARASAHDRNLILPLILVVVFLILALLLRALVAPLILTATVVLSFAAAIGVSAFFFDHVFGFGGADTAFPLFVFVFLVALGIDYNIFLMTRVPGGGGQSAMPGGARSPGWPRPAG